MSTIDSNPRKAKQSELADLQSEYADKKKKLVKQQEAEIGDMKDYYESRKAALQEQNEAAINHIRSTQSVQGEKAAAERARLYDRQKAAVDQVEQKYRSELEDTQAKRAAQLESVRTTTHEKVKDVVDDSQHKIKEVREQSQAEIMQAKERQKKETTYLTEANDKRLAQIRDNNERTIRDTTERGQIVQEKVRENQQRDYDKVREMGDQKINQEKEIKAKQVERVQVDGEKRYQKSQQQWDAKQQHLDESYAKKVENLRVAHEQQVKTQANHYKSTFDKNEQQNNESLLIQKDMLNRELNDTKKKFFKSAEKYSSKENDPFYKVQDRGSFMRENSDFYIVKAFVPEHEKENVKVTVHDDRVTIAGQRAFKDSVEEADRKVASSSFQTFKEEFAFEKPVVTEGMTRVRDGDWVEYRIPKLASAGFSKKV